MNQPVINARREAVRNAYASAESENNLRFLEGDDKATSEYIYQNQRDDAKNIVDEFYNGNRRVISITKKTKVGMDGLMIYIALLMMLHPDDSFVVNPANLRIITGMSNAGWEKDMIDKAPQCVKDKIFHHGKLKKADLKNLKNSLIIIDEIDTGDKEYQVLHNTLKDAGVLDVKCMTENNNRFVFASATMIRELHDLYCWGDLHKWYQMTIPENYIGHKEFLEKNIIQEFYSLKDEDDAETWIQEDIIDNYGNDFRVHLARVTIKTVNSLQNACIRKGVVFKNHTSTDKLSPEEIKELFQEPLSNHIVLGIKGFFRRANLIPNKWKLRIGATHELWVKIVDNNVQIQGLPGRMTGYWKDVINAGHKTGPHRTSIKAVEEYERVFNNPFGLNSYQTSGFKKTDGVVKKSSATLVSIKHVTGLEEFSVSLPVVENPNDPKTIPLVISVSSEQYATIRKQGSEWSDESIYNVIASCYGEGLVEELKRIKISGGKDQIVEPSETATTYNVYITDFASAAENNLRKWHIGNIANKYIDKFQIYLDKVQKRIIVSMYYGTKVKKPTNATA